jgi:hypothetical protein
MWTRSAFLGSISIDPASGCWKLLTVKTRGHYSHRVAYRLFIGEVLTGLNVCHTCDNPDCCNPRHLWVGTQKENLQDASRKGRLVCSEELKAIHRNISHETREKLRAANLGKTLSQETKDKIGKASLGRKHSRISKDKIQPPHCVE